jgi:uncharacterized protein involved in exopolysaccharide biosynthesis
MGTITNEGLIEKEKEPTTSAGVEKVQNWLAAASHLWSRRIRLLVWTVVGTLLSALLTLRICKYEATAQIMPPDSPGGGMAALAVPSLLKSPGLAGLAGMAGDMLGIKSTGALFAKVLQSRTVEDNLIDHFDLRKHYGKKYWEDARDKLQSRTTISEDKKSGVISVTVRDPDPKLAADLAAAYVRELDLIMLQTSTSAARRERIFIEQRLQEEKKNLDEAERRFSQFASSSMALDIPQQTRVMVESAARLQGELIAARAELGGLEQIYTGENTRVKTLRTRVNELQRELDRLNGNTGNPRSGDSPKSPYPSVKNLPLVGLEWTNLYRNTKIRETVFELLTQQYEVAQIQEAKEIPTVKVLDKAVVPERRHPSPRLLIALGALISAILACLGLLLQYRWQKRSPDDPWRILLATIFDRKKDVSAI